MNIDQKIFFILLMVIAGLGIFFVYYAIRRLKRIETLIQSLNAKPAGVDAWSVPCGHDRAVLSYVQGTRHSPSKVSLGLKGNFSGPCVIRKETALDKLSKAVGVNREAQVLDPSIEDKYYFECEDDEFVKSLVKHPAAKSAIRQALEDFDKIEIKEDSCVFVKVPADILSFRPEQLARNISKMAELIPCIPVALPPQAPGTSPTGDFETKRKTWYGWSVLLLALDFIYFVFAGIELYRPVFPMHLFLASLQVSIPVNLFLAVVAVKELRGHSTSAQALGSVIGLGCTGVGLFIWIAMIVLNGFPDRSVPVNHDVRIIDKYISYSKKHGDSYYFRVKPWQPGQSPYEIKVKKSVYDRTPVSSSCVIETKKGLLGHEWISGSWCHQAL